MSTLNIQTNSDSPLNNGFLLGAWHVLPERNLIRRDNEEKHLENRLMQTLIFLAEREGKTITREEFFKSVWQDRVVNEEALSRAVSLLRTALEDVTRKPEYIQTIPGVGYRLIAKVKPAGQPETPSAARALPVNSIAVLPFLNLSDEEANVYFSEGISEEILNVLTQVERFKVAGRTSSFMFKDSERDLREIGNTLGVANVLEGSVRKAGSRVRITAQLIETVDGFHLWSKTYDRELGDIFAVQDEIAEAVVSQLKLSLLPAKQSASKIDPRAYALQLQARHLERQSTPESYAEGLELCEQALSISPSSAECWQVKASIYCNYAGKGNIPPDEGHRQSIIAAEKALELNPNHAAAHATLGWIALHSRFDLKSAASHYQQAFALAPGDSGILSSSANLARSLGRLDTAIALQAYANERDPMNPSGHTYLGFFYRCAGQYEAAIASYRIALSLSPEIISAQYNIGASRMLQGQLDEALAETLKEKTKGYRLMGLAPIYHAMGESSKSDTALNEFIRLYAEEGAYNVAFMLACRGEIDRAFEWLEIALKNHDHGLGQINVEPKTANLHNDPRWEPFMERIGMANHQLAKVNFEVNIPYDI